jgi:ferredoxin
MDGDSLPVSAFLNHVTASSSWALPLMRSAAWPSWSPSGPRPSASQCNQCAYVCPHATIRPFAMTEEEAKAAPANASIVDLKRGGYKYTIAVSPLDCMGCGVCVSVCPTKSLKMVPRRARPPAGRVRLLRLQGLREEGRHQRHRQGQPVPPAVCWSSPAPAQAAPRPATPVSSPSSSAITCSSPTPPAARPSGAARLPPARTP